VRGESLPTVAALYVHETGPYVGREGVDPWPASRDARAYAGPFPVVAHPPCERWGRYWSGGPSPLSRRRELGDDGECFLAALEAVCRWGGVLEHPEASHAFRRYGLVPPPRRGGWHHAGLVRGGWTCCVEQGHYGHPARKATWLYVSGLSATGLPELAWGPAARGLRLEDGFHSREERRRATRTGICQRLSKRQRAITPEPFVEVLLDLARLVYRRSAT
jgi:hypothetical protein